jgi:hypothetical protein
MFHLFIKKFLNKKDLSNENVSPTSSEKKILFKLPIEYIDSTYVHSLSPNVANDLELADSITENKPMYDFMLNPEHIYGKNMIQKWKNKYTTNIPFLRDSQNVIRETSIYLDKLSCSTKYKINCEKMNEIWKNVKEDSSFLEKYSFIEWSLLEHLNDSSTFLQCMALMNIMSPIMSLFIPIIFLILPFIILKIQKIPIDFKMYLEILKSIAKNHFIGKTLLTMNNITIEKMIYLGITIAFYLLQIYQNIMSCIRFYNNIRQMNEYLIELKEYLHYSIHSMEIFTELHKNKENYRLFCDETSKHSIYLKEFLSELESINPFQMNVSKFSELGYMLKCYYHFYTNKNYHDAMQYSFEFEGYINNIIGIHENILAKHIHFANFDENEDCVIEKQYYPPYKEGEHVKNTCSFNKNIIISAPNASGKTTFIKTSSINIIFTQQFGCGFYKSCRLNPYSHIHSYLNIPDTSGRDSLFQAESRRCKEIIDIIHENQEDRHFCIFDELYSGTNPTEATKAACAFLTYISNFKNVNFILTTHYVSVCNKFKKSKNIKNYKMQVESLDDGKLKYTYKLKPGISKIQGAIKILKEMNYPKEIITNIENF